MPDVGVEYKRCAGSSWLAVVLLFLLHHQIHCDELLKRIEILGTEGSAVLEEESLVKWEFKDERPEDAHIRDEMLDATKTGGGAADPKAIGSHGHQMLFESFVDSIITGKPVDVSGESAEKAVEIIEAAYRSAKEHAPVKLPL